MLMLEYLIGLIAPHVCVGCGKEGSLLCNDCIVQYLPSLPGVCYRCNRLSTDSRVCVSCRRSSSLYYVWVRAEYEGVAQALVYKLKFERANQAARPIGDLMAEGLPYGMLNTVVVPLPTASSRVRLRGYDHAVLIARAIAKVRNLKHANALRRLGSARQVGASRSKRLAQLEGAFYCPHPELVAGKHILLIDDVITTGASIEQAAKVLKKAGAQRVSAVIFAKKQ